MDVKEKELKRIYRHKRIRKKMSGNAQRLRVCVHRSHQHLYAQIVDDTKGQVLFGASTLTKNVRSKIKNGGNVEAATVLGEYFAQEAKKKGIQRIAFDRGGYLYHGRVKAFAEAVRKAGMEF